jgi:hypothetical protein
LNTALTITPADFARSFGITAGEMPPAVHELIARSDFRYHPLPPQEQDQVIKEISQKLDTNAFTTVGAHRKEVWEQGWMENLQEFAQKGYALEKLVPRFVRPNPIVRLNQQFVRAHDPQFEYRFFTVLRLYLFTRYLDGAEALYEFGCGSGYNLVALAELHPEMELHGLDWAESSVKLVNLIAQTHHLRLEGRRFDFFAPDPELKLVPRSVVLTMVALEQVGARFEEFLQFLLRQSPLLCITMEPLLDLYDLNNLVDSLAIRYHTQRGYLNGYLARLRQLADEGRIEILKIQRLRFGSLYNEGYSYVVWRPLNNGPRT